MKRSEKIQEVEVNKIKMAKYEPPSRLLPDALKNLKEGIEDLGMIVFPLLLDEDYNLIDGHRRLTVAKMLDWKTVPCIFIDAFDKTDSVFQKINDGSRKLGSADETFVYLRGGSVSKDTEKAINKLIDLVGKENIEKAMQLSPKNRFSAKSVVTVFSVLRKHIEKKLVLPEPFWKQALLWMIFQNQSHYIRTAVTVGMKQELIVSAINDDRSLF